MDKCSQSTEEDIKRQKRKCWGCGKQIRIKFYDWTGWEYCFKCWLRDYKDGRGQGFWRAIKELKVKIFIK